MNMDDFKDLLVIGIPLGMVLAVLGIFMFG